MANVNPREIEFGPFSIDTGVCQLRRDGEAVALPPKAFDMLRALIEADGRLVSKEDLMKILWPDTFVAESNLTQTVFVLRKALGESAGAPRYIATVAGRGYRFAAPSADAAGAPHPPVWTGGRLRLASALALTVLVAVAVWLLRLPRAFPSSASMGSRVMLAVLPFENLIGDHSQDYFSDGLTDEMITELGTIDPAHLGVIAGTSVERYKNRPTALARVGDELRVRYVVEGAVRRNGARIHITARLVQVVDHTELWAHAYDRDLGDLFDVQSEVARAIANRVQATLGEQGHLVERARTASMTPSAYEAYDLYLRGRALWKHRNGPSLLQSIAFFQQSIAKDPAGAHAYAGLADAYTMLSTYYFEVPAESMPKARAAALRALEIDDGLAEAHVSLALIAETYDWNWRTAEREYRRAIAIDPGYATAHHWLAECLMFEGRFNEALDESERARRLDPMSLIVAADHGVILFYARRYDRAIQQFRAVLAQEPSFPRAQMITSAYLENGQYADALAAIDRPAAVPRSLWTVAGEAAIFARMGQAARARSAVERLQRVNRARGLDPWLLTMAYLAVGDFDGAFEQLERAYQIHSPSLTALRVDPIYDPVRRDPRYASLLHRVGLDQDSSSGASRPTERPISQ